MIKVLDTSLNTLAILQNVISPIITEELNREFTFSFTTVIDNDKSNYVNYQNIIENSSNYFNIVYTEENRTADGLMINAQCEHVSYDLLSANFTAGFTATGQFSAVATTLLSGTGFTVGTVQITASQTISVNQSTNARQILMQLATLYGGELKFDKYAISLYTQRGADRGVQFRYRKNLVDVSRIVDNRTKVAGLPTISYKVNVGELEFEEGFIADGASALEHYELGDTVRVIDADLNLDVLLRIYKESHDTEQRMQGTVEIANFVTDVTDTITQIQTTSIAKDNVYNGCSIGPDLGFVAERSDGIAKTSMNATNGIEIDLRNTITASYSAVFYVAIDTATSTATLYLAGNAIFKGKVEIGSGNNIFIADGSSGIWLGNASFTTAPFNVTLSGALTANSATIRGDIIAGSTFTVATGSNTIRADSSGLYVGASAFATAPFNVTLSGALTANSATIRGDIIAGSTFTVATGSNTIRADSSGLYVGASAFATAPFNVTLSGALTATNGNFIGTITGSDITAIGHLKVSSTDQPVGYGNAGLQFGTAAAYIEYQEVTPAYNSDFRIVVPNGEVTICNSLGVRIMDWAESAFTDLYAANIYSNSSLVATQAWCNANFVHL